MFARVATSPAFFFVLSSLTSATIIGSLGAGAGVSGVAGNIFAGVVAGVGVDPNPGISAGASGGVIAGDTAIVGTIQCRTGSLYCCNSLLPADSSNIVGLLAPFGIAAGAVNTAFGLACSIIGGTFDGNTGASCTREPLCCTGNTYAGVEGDLPNLIPGIVSSVFPYDLVGECTPVY